MTFPTPTPDRWDPRSPEPDDRSAPAAPLPSHADAWPSSADAWPPGAPAPDPTDPRPAPGTFGPAGPPVVAAPRERRSPLVAAVAIVALLAGSALFVSGFSLGRQTATTPGTPPGEQEAFRAFWDAYRAITDRYVGEEVATKTLVEGAIKGMFEALGDPYSSYLTSEEYRDSLRGIAGEFEGIGAEIGTRSSDPEDPDCATLGPDCRLVVIAPLEGSPAERAGVLAGDAILAADGTSLDGLTVDEARDRIRGPKGTAVVLTLERDGGEPFDVSITRDTIVSREVIEEDLADGEVGYVRLTGFSEHGADQLAEEVAEDIEAGRTKLILDLRGNPGGFVTAAVDVASVYLGTGTVFWEERADGSLVETTAEADGPATDPELDLVVLVDEGSASASEIVAGALQDRGRATIVGETTFGKGTVQQWTPLEDDHGGFRLTVAKWLTPDRSWVHGTGITPDVPVVDPDDDDVDLALEEALEVLGAATAAGPDPSP